MVSFVTPFRVRPASALATLPVKLTVLPLKQMLLTFVTAIQILLHALAAAAPGCSCQPRKQTLLAETGACISCSFKFDLIDVWQKPQVHILNQCLVMAAPFYANIIQVPPELKNEPSCGLNGDSYQCS